MMIEKCNVYNDKYLMDLNIYHTFLEVLILKEKMNLKAINKNDILQLQDYFILQKSKLDNIVLPDKLLKKYFDNLQLLWSSYSFHQGNRVHEKKVNLFEELFKAQNKHSMDDEFAKMLNRIEKFWCASNQSFIYYFLLQIENRNIRIKLKNRNIQKLIIYIYQEIYFKSFSNDSLQTIITKTLSLVSNHSSDAYYSGISRFLEYALDMLSAPNIEPSNLNKLKDYIMSNEFIRTKQIVKKIKHEMVFMKEN